MKRYSVATVEDIGIVPLDPTVRTDLETAIKLRNDMSRTFTKPQFVVVNMETIETDLKDDLGWITDYVFDNDDPIRKEY
jgi:hypothetical protein